MILSFQQITLINADKIRIICQDRSYQREIIFGVFIKNIYLLSLLYLSKTSLYETP
jgi:hypothetical protein